jgi:class 3 adenylate cyclase
VGAEPDPGRPAPFILERPPPPPEVRSGLATVLFTDLVGSTLREAQVGDQRWGAMLDSHDRLCAEVVGHGGGRMVKQTGDGVLAVFDDPVRAVNAALDLARQLPVLGLSARAGLHTGIVERRGDGDVAGISVNIAARVQALADAGEVLVSRTLRDLLLGSGYQFRDRGSHQLKGVDGAWDLFEVID